MKPAERDAAHLWDLLDAARRMRKLVSGLDLEAVMADQRTRLALERVFEVMGAAARRVSEEGRVRHAEIDWRSIIAIPSAIDPRVEDIDYSRLWAVATLTLPALIGVLERILGEQAAS
jgi:uncharacterized protein with HEPN domain